MGLTPRLREGRLFDIGMGSRWDLYGDVGPRHTVVVIALLPISAHFYKIIILLPDLGVARVQQSQYPKTWW